MYNMYKFNILTYKSFDLYSTTDKRYSFQRTLTAHEEKSMYTFTRRDFNKYFKIKKHYFII